MPEPIRILYVGDSWLTAGTLGAYSSLTYDLRGVSVENQASRIVDHWHESPDFEVDYLTGWDALARFPETPEAIRKYHVIFLSDVESDTLVLYPMERSMRSPMGPNRLKLVREFVRDGGGLSMIGGYASFTGRQNVGNYAFTPVEDVLPVLCSRRNDDRMETPEGVTAQVKVPEHVIMQGLTWAPRPLFNGYNKLESKPGCTVLATVNDPEDPLLVVGEFGKGRSLAFASDVAPHWGADFQDWAGCHQFLDQAVRWLAGKSE